MSGSDSAAVPFVFSARNNLKAAHKSQVIERGGETESPRRDSRVKVCRYCRRGFESRKDFYGHLRRHIVSRDMSITRILRSNDLNRGTKRSPEEDDGFGCLVCCQSFLSIQLLCRHMRIHRGNVFNGVRQPPSTSQERTLFPSTDHNDTSPLRFYHVPAKRPWKKNKTEDTLMEGASADSEIILEHFSNLKIETNPGHDMKEDC